MTKISEVVTIYPGMSNTVNLRNEFTDLDKNRKRMRGYKPITSHRKIFLKIASSFMPNANKVHLLVGHYGTGKSHLLLMLANYFSLTPAMPELKAFFENFDLADQSISRQVQNLRGSGRYLAVIPDYDSLEDFSENMLSALEDAFRREDIQEAIDSIYQEALRLLQQWQADETAGKDALRKFSAFQDALNKEPGTYNALRNLKAGLKNYERAALDMFRDIYQRLIGSRFRYDASNIVKILEDIIRSDAFKKRFKGIVFLYDEFDHTLKNRRISIEVVQQFAELCKNSNEIVFIGSLHKELSAFADEYSVQDFKTVQQRFKTIDMQADGLEEIATAIVQVKKDHPEFKTVIAPNLNQVYQKIPMIQSMGLFDWLQPPEIQEKIIDAVYPLHPLTMACLLELSTVIGSSNRTLFTFLGGEGIDQDNDHSYKAFIEENNIFDNSGRLALYTPDYLADYFAKELDLDNADLRKTIKTSVMGWRASVKELNKNINREGTLFKDVPPFLAPRILKLMLIFEILNISNNDNNLTFGLNIQLAEKNTLKKKLKQLAWQKVIFFSKTSQTYEFRRGTDIDWDSIIQVEKERLIETGEFDLADEFLTICKTPGQAKFLDAKKYNKIKSADKRLLRVFETVKNFGKPQKGAKLKASDYFKLFEKDLLAPKPWKDSYDGVIIYVIAETDSEIKESRHRVRENHSDYVLAVIPEKPLPVKDTFLEIKAALSVKDSDEYTSAPVADQARLEETYIGDINKGRFQQFSKLREKYISGRLAAWYGQDGTIIEDKPADEKEPVYNFLTKLYPKFNAINDEEFNRCHKALTKPKKLILRDAVNHLLEAGKTIEIDTGFGNNKGFIRYLKNIFFDRQLLGKTGQKGSLLLCEIEKNTSKYKDVFPAAADMIDAFKSKKSVNVMQFINQFKAAPYGLGEVSLELFGSYLIKYFGDELAYKRKPDDPGEISVQSYDQIKEIVNKPGPLAVFEKRTLNRVEKAFLTALYQIYSKTPLAVNDVPSLKEVIAAIKAWYEGLCKLARAEDFYSDKGVEKGIRNYLQVLKKLDMHEPFHFIFNHIQTAWGHEADERFDETIKQKILEGIRVFNPQIDKKEAAMEDRILQEFIAVFEAKGKTFSNLGDAINQWYNRLETHQLNILEEWHTKESQPLIRHLKDTQNLRKILFKTLPADTDYDLGKIADWSTDNVKIYTHKVKEGLRVIEKNKILVAPPILKVNNGEMKDKSKTKKLVHYGHEDFDLTVSVPEGASAVWISYHGNPREASSQKEIVKTKKKLVSPNKDNQNIQLVTVDQDGNFSKVVSIQLQEKYGIKEGMYDWEVPIPKNLQDARLTIRSFANKLLEKKTVTHTELSTILAKLAEEYHHEN
jgi:hypothetical protein